MSGILAVMGAGAGPHRDHRHGTDIGVRVGQSPPSVRLSGPNVATTPSGWTVVADGWIAGGSIAHVLATAFDVPVPATALPDALPRVGEFAAVAHHQPSGRLVAVRDPLGGRPLFWWRRGEQVTVASSMAAILAHPGVPREPNEGAVAEWIAGQPTSPLETVWRGIERVRAGHILQLAPRPPRSHRIVELPTEPGGVADPAGALRAAAERAVTAAAIDATSLGAELSGGLDSSTVVGLARSLGMSLRTFTLTFPGLACDESAHVRATERWSGHATERVPATPVHDEKRRELVRRYGHPGMLVLGQQRARREAARAGVDVMFTGFWGDELLGSLGWAADDLLVTGRLAAAWRHPLRRRSLRAMLGRSYRDRMLQHAGPWVRRRWLDGPPPWVPTDLAERTDLRDRVTAVAPSEHRLPSRRWLAVMLDSWGTQSRAELQLGDIEPHPDIRAPLGTRDLLELAFAIPEDVKAPGADIRHLHRRAFGDVLAPEVRRRTDKAVFSPSWHEHRRASDVRIDPDSRLVEFGWIDLGAFEQVVREVDAAAQDQAYHPHLTTVTTIEDIELWAQEWL